MATIQAVTASDVASLGANISITKPTGTVSGDLLLFVVTTFGTAPSTVTSTGFTIVKHATTNVWFGWKIAGGSEGTNYTITRTGTTSVAMSANMYRITGFDTTTPIDVNSSVLSTSSLTSIIPSMTVTNPGLIVSTLFKTGNITPTSTPPSGMTFGGDINSQANTASAWAYNSATAGATGTQTWTSTSNATATASMVIVNDPIPVAKSGSDTASVSISDSSSVSVPSTPISGSETPSLSIAETSKINVLGTFHQAFANRNTALVNIGMIGASIVEGAKAPLDKSVEVKLSKKLRSLYPTTGSGWGYIGIPSFQVTNTGLTQITWSGGTYNETFGFGEHHGVWLSSAAAGGVLTFTNPAPATTIKLGTFTWAFGSATGGQYRINNGSWVTFNTYGPSTQIQDVTITGPFKTGDTIQVKHGGGDGSSLYISGFTHYNGDETAGVLVHNYGHFGYTTDEWLAGNGGYPQWNNEIYAQNLNLLIVSDIGANDAAENGGKTSAQVKIDYVSFLNRVRAGGYTGPLLLVAVYDFSFGYPTLEPWVNYVQVIKEVAKEYGANFLDLNAVMPPTPNAIYDSDNIHTNVNGAANEMIADYMVNALFPDVVLPTAKVGEEYPAISIAETTSRFVTLDAVDSVSISASDSSAVAANLVVSASDSASVTISDTSSLSSYSNVSDSPSISITESSGIFSTQSTNDSASIAISDTSATVVYITAADSSAVSISDTSSLSSASNISGSDAASVTITDISQTSVTVSRTDTAAITIADSSAVVSYPSANESASIAISETNTITKTMVSSETSSVSVSETTSTLVNDSKSTTDSASVSVSESSSLNVLNSSADVASVTISETSTSFITVESEDGSTLFLADPALDLSVVEAASDDVTISITETSATSILDQRTLFDGSALVVSESTQQFVTISTADSSGLSIAEVSSFARDISSNESTAISINESAAASVSLSRSDNASVTITENTSGNNSVTATETNALSISETYVLKLSISASDTSSVTISESSDQEGINALPTSDTSSLSVSESSSIATGVAGTDTAAASATETTSTSSIGTTADNVTISIAETRSVLVTMSSSDNGSLAISESATMALTLDAIDEVTVAATEATELLTTKTISSDDYTLMTITEFNEFVKGLSDSDISGIKIVGTVVVDGRPEAEAVYIYVGMSSDLQARFESASNTGTMIGEYNSTKQQIGGTSAIGQRLE